MESPYKNSWPDQAVVDSHSFFFILWKSMGITNCLFTNIIQNIFVHVQHKKEIHTGLEMESE